MAQVAVMHTVLRRIPGVAWVALPPLVFTVLMVLIPVGALLGRTSHFDLAGVWNDAHLRWRLLWSLTQAGLSVGLCLLLGLPLAWLLARREWPGRSALLQLVALPFVVPTLVAALGVLAWLGPQGLLGRALGWDLEDGPVLLLVGNLFFNLGLVVRAGVEGFEQVGASRVDAARTLGATPWRVFRRVEWPAARPWFVSALCLVFVYCFGGFGLALVLGGPRWSTVDVEIYTLVAEELALDEAAVLAAVTLACSGLTVLGYNLLERRRARPRATDPLPRQPLHGAREILAALLATIGVLGVAGAPLLSVAWRALAGGVTGWQALADVEVLAALARSLGFAAVTTLAAGALGLAQGVAAHRWPWLRALAWLPLTVSPVILAFGLLRAYPGQAASLVLLLATYTLLATPFVAQAVVTGLESVPPRLVAAARSLGATPWRAFWRVTWPLVRPAWRRGLALAATSALGEFAATLFLSRPEWTTLTTLIYRLLGRPGASHLQTALLLSLLLLALCAVMLATLGRHTPALTAADVRPATAGQAAQAD